MISIHPSVPADVGREGVRAGEGAGLLGLVGCALAAGAAFHAAFAVAALSWGVVVCLALVLRLRHARSARAAFWCGTLAGLGVLVPRLGFLWEVFGVKAAGVTVSVLCPVLWLLVAAFHGLFVVLVRAAGRRWGDVAALALAPVLWTGLEYLRSEAWWLRFPWFTAGEAFDAVPSLLHAAGVYGAGGLAMALAAAATGLVTARAGARRGWATAVAGVLALAVAAALPSRRNTPDTRARSVVVAGLQLETPAVPDVLAGLDRVLQRHPAAQLVVLGEYTLEGPPPASLRRWCREHRRWLLVGGTEPVAAAGTGSSGTPLRAGPAAGAPFRNTAFVVGPSGEVEFTQGKSVPIQFFNDGLPAERQAVWESPWGKVGIAVCYDAGYRRVMDRFVSAGAEALVVIAMDAESWGADEHFLNARMAWCRGHEYGLPVVRVATSGESGVRDARGVMRAAAGCPGQGETLSAEVRLAGPGRVPWDAWAAPWALAATAAVAAVLASGALRGHAAGTPPVRP